MDKPTNPLRKLVPPSPEDRVAELLRQIAEAQDAPTQSMSQRQRIARIMALRHRKKK